MSDPSPLLPPLSPPPITSFSKKRLLANRKQPIPKFSPESQALLYKITQDLLNLLECYGYGLQIDYGNPKAPLQPLDSFWWILLLYGKCIRSSEASMSYTINPNLRPSHMLNFRNLDLGLVKVERLQHNELQNLFRILGKILMELK